MCLDFFHGVLDRVVDDRVVVEFLEFRELHFPLGQVQAPADAFGDLRAALLEPPAQLVLAGRH